MWSTERLPRNVSGSGYRSKFIKKTRLEIAVNENFVEVTIDSIIEGARTGEIGDGKIFILPLEQCIRIRSGEEGTEAIG